MILYDKNDINELKNRKNRNPKIVFLTPIKNESAHQKIVYTDCKYIKNKKKISCRGTLYDHHKRRYCMLNTHTQTNTHARAHIHETKNSIFRFLIHPTCLYDVISTTFFFTVSKLPLAKK